ncbi:MAG: HrcA family transcriptional regulator, partial [Terriglobales bacterium]
APQALTAGGESQKLERALREASDEATMWRCASEFLSEISQQVGVVAVQPWRDAGLRHLRFFCLTEQRVLAILVATDGQVRERVCRVPERYSQDELDAAARYFNQYFAGATLARIRRELMHRIEEERAAYDQLLKRVVVLTHCGVLSMQDAGEVYVQGAPHLAGAIEGEQLGLMLARLSQKEQWLELLMRVSEKEEGMPANLVEWDSGAAGAGPRHWVRVRVGLDREQMPGFSLITTNHPQGALGILGTTRMEYQRALGAVALVRELFERVWGGQPS